MHLVALAVASSANVDADGECNDHRDDYTSDDARGQSTATNATSLICR